MNGAVIPEKTKVDAYGWFHYNGYHKALKIEGVAHYSDADSPNPVSTVAGFLKKKKKLNFFHHSVPVALAWREKDDPPPPPSAPFSSKIQTQFKSLSSSLSLYIYIYISKSIFWWGILVYIFCCYFSI